MYSAQFDYVRPSTIDEAVALLGRHGDEAKLLAGGHSLIPAMKLRLARPKLVIDIGRIAGLSYIRESGGALAIGAMTTHQEIESSPLVRSKSPLLAETAARIGDMQVRNRGTLGGSLVHADPAADYPASILALEADVDLVGPRGRRTVHARDFFVDLLQTAAAPDEILVEVRVPATSASVAYVKTEQKASGFALTGVAVVVTGDRVRVGVTGVAPSAYRAEAVERAIGNARPLTAGIIASASQHATDGIEPLSDVHASADFRAHLARVNTRRALEAAAAR
jgi:carbon-monoxide dehydrogenase medium subunit